MPLAAQLPSVRDVVAAITDWCTSCPDLTGYAVRLVHVNLPRDRPDRDGIQVELEIGGDRGTKTLYLQVCQHPSAGLYIADELQSLASRMRARATDSRSAPQVDRATLARWLKAAVWHAGRRNRKPPQPGDLIIERKTAESGLVDPLEGVGVFVGREEDPEWPQPMTLVRDLDGTIQRWAAGEFLTCPSEIPDQTIDPQAN